ncbi:ricin-type beta-trefoil lectin domain protein [Streptomyces sp. CB01881]|uniref:ricin-type beta-trefoil lectin domain protein n=1 Tax=Streptomyces sp. CB01881 TaxID=2078691 RepID=UPI000CDC3DAF|nr:ricin-type beta-trefoil lectin domain protein [Streptomyces sp. CB01881]AUY52256.1 hypothetical protein C2142_28740 [Streptomyces sp. CB01881]TYC71678.1 hypothetical protein EH183_28725 [Streptomyces sp. CB01881]
MRRTASLFATALLAGAAALTAPAANAAEPAPSAGARSAQAASAADNCSVAANPGGGLAATCSGLDPMQTWAYGGSCVSYASGRQVFSPGWGSGWVAGNTTAAAGCYGTATPWMFQFTFGPAVPAGPVGQVTGFGNKCLDVRGGSTRNGTPTQIWDCLGNVNQTWKVGADGTIRGVGMCLDVQGGGTGNGTPVETNACNGATAQQWRVRADGSILNPRSGRCLDVRGVVDTNGTVVQLWDCYGSANQTWHAPA